MTHPENNTPHAVSQVLQTVAVDFCDTPIDNRGERILQVVAGIAAEDALETARALSSGLGQLCKNLHDALNMGELAYCDGLTAMGFLAETVSALVYSVQKGQNKGASQ